MILSQTMPPLRHRRAFSLVETVLALGIAATMLLVIFSLMPIGMSSLQEAQRQIVETEIYSKISSELTTTATYDSVDPSVRRNLLSDYCSSNRFPAYFDVEGNESKTPAQAVFTVRCAVVSTPGTVWSPAGVSASGELLSSTVRIGFHRDPDADSTAKLNVRQRVFLLSNHGT